MIKGESHNEDWKSIVSVFIKQKVGITRGNGSKHTNVRNAIQFLLDQESSGAHK